MRFRLLARLVAVAAAGTLAAGATGVVVSAQHDEVAPVDDRVAERVRAAGTGEIRPAPDPVPANDMDDIKDELVANADPQELAAHLTPAPPPAPEPEPVVEEAAAPAVASGSVWDRLAQCEAGGNWASTVGTYEGGLQFHPSTWDAYKPAGYPGAAYEASREQQIAVGELVLADQGWGAWPACSRKLGLR